MGLECHLWCWLPVKVPVNATMWLKCVLPVPRRHHGAGVCEARGTGPVPEEEHVCLSQLETRRGQTTGLCSQLPGEKYPSMHDKLATNDKIQNYGIFRTKSVISFNLLVLVFISQYWILHFKTLKTKMFWLNNLWGDWSFISHNIKMVMVWFQLDI